METNELIASMLDDIECTILEAEEDLNCKTKRLDFALKAAQKSKERLERLKVLRLNLLYLMGE